MREAEVGVPGECLREKRGGSSTTPGGEELGCIAHSHADSSGAPGVFGWQRPVACTRQSDHDSKFVRTYSVNPKMPKRLQVSKSTTTLISHLPDQRVCGWVRGRRCWRWRHRPCFAFGWHHRRTFSDFEHANLHHEIYIRAHSSCSATLHPPLRDVDALNFSVATQETGGKGSFPFIMSLSLPASPFLPSSVQS